jgi:hypothetical protein
LLGFESTEKKVIFTAIFGRICLAQGQPKAAVDELAAALSETSAGEYPLVERLLDELKQGASR